MPFNLCHYNMMNREIDLEKGLSPTDPSDKSLDSTGSTDTGKRSNQLQLKNGRKMTVIKTNQKMSIDSSGVMAGKIKKVVNEFIMDDVEYIMLWRHRWYLIMSIASTFAHIFLFLSSFLAFGSKYYGSADWGFITGCFSMFVMSLNQLANFAKVKSEQKTDEINKILESYDVDTMVPDFTVQETTDRGITDRGITDRAPNEPTTAKVNAEINAKNITKTT